VNLKENKDKMKVLANDGISDLGAQKLEAAGFTVITDKVAQEQLSAYMNENQVEILLVRSATKVREVLINECPGLKLVGRGGVGMDNIDVEYARSKGVKVINTPASSSDSVAEIVFAHLFGMVRFLHDSNRQMPLSGDTQFNQLKKAYANGIELSGKTLGIIGFGRIGQAVAKRAIGLGMNVLVGDLELGKSTKVELRFFNGQSLSFNFVNQAMDEVISQSDFISVHVPNTDKPIIGKRELEKMKKGAFIVNAARGGVIDEVALVEALNSGHIAGAGLDVFENEPTPAMPVLMNTHVSLSPHIGAATLEAQDRIGEELADLIVAEFGTFTA
jgi:D-3-phosphoglycerate dehydrogenase / 2-oxoglutarate reductase